MLFQGTISGLCVEPAKCSQVALEASFNGARVPGGWPCLLSWVFTCQFLPRHSEVRTATVCVSVTGTPAPRPKHHVSSAPYLVQFLTIEQQPGCFRNLSNNDWSDCQIPKQSIFVVFAAKLVFQRYKLVGRVVYGSRQSPGRGHITSREIIGPEKGLQGGDSRYLGTGAPEQARTCL